MPDGTVHTITSDNIRLIERHLLSVDDVIQYTSSKSILKIINWDELGVYSGIYRWARKNSGDLGEASSEGGILVPSRKSNTQSFGTSQPDGGIYKRKNNDTGIL